AACKLSQEFMQTEYKRLGDLRSYLEKSLLGLEETYVNGLTSNRLPHVTNMQFRFLKAEQIMVSLGNIAMASGSACSTGSLDPSHVLLAMGLDKDDARASLRLSLGRFNTREEIDRAIDQLTEKVKALRQESPAWQLFKKDLIK